MTLLIELFFFISSFWLKLRVLKFTNPKEKFNWFKVIRFNPMITRSSLLKVIRGFTRSLTSRSYNNIIQGARKLFETIIKIK